MRIAKGNGWWVSGIYNLLNDFLSRYQPKAKKFFSYKSPFLFTETIICKSNWLKHKNSVIMNYTFVIQKVDIKCKRIKFLGFVTCRTYWWNTYPVSHTYRNELVIDPQVIMNAFASHFDSVFLPICTSSNSSSVKLFTYYL